MLESPTVAVVSLASRPRVSVDDRRDGPTAAEPGSKSSPVVTSMHRFFSHLPGSRVCGRSLVRNHQHEHALQQPMSAGHRLEVAL